MTHPDYRNLTKSELEIADHYFESGNFSELQRMKELSASRVGTTATRFNLNDHIIRDDE